MPTQLKHCYVDDGAPVIDGESCFTGRHYCKAYDVVRRGTALASRSGLVSVIIFTSAHQLVGSCGLHIQPGVSPILDLGNESPSLLVLTAQRRPSPTPVDGFIPALVAATAVSCTACVSVSRRDHLCDVECTHLQDITTAMGRKAYTEQVMEKQMVSDDPQELRASKTLAPVLLGK